MSTLSPAVSDTGVLAARSLLQEPGSWLMVAEGWAALYFEQASPVTDAGSPADHTFRKWVLGKESASQAHNRFSINI